MKPQRKVDGIACYLTASETFGQAEVFVDFEPIEDGEPALVSLELNDDKGNRETEMHFGEERLADLVRAVLYAADEVERHRRERKKYGLDESDIG